MTAFYTEKEVLARGWSQKGIQLYIGKPNKIVQGEKFYSQTRVISSETFLTKQGCKHLMGVE